MNNLIRETIMPESEAAWLELRKQDLTSTDIAALFGLSPYKTAFELWWEKREQAGSAFKDNPRMRWGRRLESTVAHGIADDMNWCIAPFKEYMRIPDQRIGSSFDFYVNRFDRPEPPVFPQSPDRLAILEIKTVDYLAFRDGWTVEEDFIEAPAHIELQVQHQMLVSGLPRAYLGAMVGGNRIEVIERQADPQVHAGILARAAEFWRSIDNNSPPPPVMPDDAQAVIARNQFAEPGKLLDARTNPAILHIAAEYHKLGKEESAIKEQREVLKADLLSQIGDHEKVLLDGFTVSAGLVGEAEIPAYTRKAYRSVRVTKKTTKA